jgi:Fe-S cluster assembly iron-binding protein IscA
MPDAIEMFNEGVARLQEKAALPKSNRPPKACYPVTVGEENAAIVVDERRPGDAVIRYEGKALVVLDPTAVNKLEDCELDFEDQGLILRDAD